MGRPTYPMTARISHAPKCRPDLVGSHRDSHAAPSDVGLTRPYFGCELSVADPDASQTWANSPRQRNIGIRRTVRVCRVRAYRDCNFPPDCPGAESPDANGFLTSC